MIITNAPGGGGDALTVVTATWPSGSTCTATLGTTVIGGGTSGSGTFNLKKPGTWTIACTDGSSTASDTVTVTQSTATVTLSYGPTPGKGLENYTWAEIKQISDSGDPSTYGISVGDTKTVLLNGTFGDNTFSSQTATVKVIGINHDSTREGNGITFQLYSVGTVNDAVLVTANLYNSYTSSYHDYVMNTTSTNTGGWQSSYARTTLMPEFKAILPSDLQAVIKSTTKYSDNHGGGSDTASYVTTTSDECFLLAEYEIFGFHSDANSAEQNYQAQYAFYANGGSKIKYCHKTVGSRSQGSAVRWWERSVGSSFANRFCAVYASTAASDDNAYNSVGLAPAFRV